MDQRLEHGLKVPRRQPVAYRQRLGGHRLAAGVDRNIDHGGDRQ